METGALGPPYGHVPCHGGARSPDACAATKAPRRCRPAGAGWRGDRRPFRVPAEAPVGRCSEDPHRGRRDFRVPAWRGRAWGAGKRARRLCARNDPETGMTRIPICPEAWYGSGKGMIWSPERDRDDSGLIEAENDSETRNRYDPWTGMPTRRPE